MINISENDKIFLKKHIKNVEQLLSSNDVNDLLDVLYDLILDEGFISFEEGYNDLGREAQKVYDNIFYNN